VDRLERLINLVIALRETRRPLPADEIRRRVAGYGHDDPEAFRRMFERDKADLRALGVPVDTVPVDVWESEVGYRIDPERYDLPDVDLEPAELAALALAVEATGLGDEARWGLTKLGVATGATVGAVTGDPSAPVRRPGVGATLDTPHLAELLEAQSTRTPVRFRYRPLGREAAQRTVDPHALVHRRGRWYLVAHDRDRGARRAFRLDRIESRPRPAGPAGAFGPPPQAGTDDVLPPPPSDPTIAEVDAAPEVTWQVARRARGEGVAQPDGWTRFRVVVADDDRFVGWLLSLGPDVEVHGPPELRRRVAERLAAVATEAQTRWDAERGLP
jgi:predicted DNA-binding transcriptional regulator YafY